MNKLRRRAACLFVTAVFASAAFLALVLTTTADGRRFAAAALVIALAAAVLFVQNWRNMACARLIVENRLLCVCLAGTQRKAPKDEGFFSERSLEAVVSCFGILLDG